MYRADVTQPLTPSTPSGQGQAMEARGNAMLAESVLRGAAAGYSIFEDVQQGNFATKQAELVEEFETAGNALKAQGTAAKDVSFLQEGRPTEAAVAAFKERQQAFLEAANQFPNKFREMKQRSGALLKEYIAKYPGLADQFRKVSSDLTGIGRLDLENIRELVTDVEWLQKQQADQAKARSDYMQQLRTELVKVLTADRKMDPVSAMSLASTLNEQEMVSYARTAHAAQQATIDAQEALKVGGQKLQSYANHQRTAWTGVEHQTLGLVYLQLKQLGVSRAAAMTPEMLESPAVKTVLEQGLSDIRTKLDTFYAQTMATLNANYSKGDPTAVRQAINDVTEWYEKEKSELSTDNVWLKALAADGEGEAGDTWQKRLQQINTFRTSFGFDPLLVGKLFAGDPNSEAWKRAAAADPRAAQAALWIRKAQDRAASASPEEWNALILEWGKLSGSGMNAEPLGTPTTPAEKSMAVVSHRDLSQKIRRIGQGTVPEGTDTVDVVNRYIEGSMRTADNAQETLRNIKNLTDAISKVPEGQREAVKERAARFFDRYIYGVNMDADIAKADFVQLQENSTAEGATFNWADLSGSTPLSLAVRFPGLPAAPGLKAVEGGRGYVSANVMKAVDNKLLIRSQITGEDIRVLRKQFMTEFMKDGLPSTNRTKSTVDAISAANTQQGGTLGSPESRMTPTPGGAQVPPEVQAQRDAEAARLAQGERTPAQRLDYIMKLEKALQEGGMSPETRSFLSRELKLMRGE